MSNKAINFYERIEKLKPGTLPKVPNPNVHLHGISIPARGILVSPSGSGKTNMLLNIIQAFSHGKGTFKTISIVTNNADEPLYDYLVERGCMLYEGLQNTPDLDKFDKKEAHMVVFDDLILAKNLKIVEDYYIRCRKLNITVFFLSQRFYPIPKMIRENVTVLVVLKMGNVRDIKLILSEVAVNVTKEQLMNMYNYATKIKLDSFIIDKESDDETKKYRKNLPEYLNPEKFNTPSKAMIEDK